MKVAHLTSVHPPYDTRIFHKECRTLKDAGYEVSLVAQNTCESEFEGVLFRGVPQARSRLKRILVTTRQIYSEARSLDANLYHLHDPELLPWGWLLYQQGKTVVYDMHENVPKSIMAKEWIPVALRRPIAWIIRNFERLLLIGIPVIFAEQSYYQDYTWIKSATTVLNMPLHTELLEISKFQSNQKKCKFGYLGRVADVRGSWVMLEALQILQGRGYQVGWDCVGGVSTDHVRQLRRYCDWHGLNDVHFHGFLPARQSWRIIAGCFAGLAVLQPVPNYIESIPTKIFEYMALGLPVIVSDFPIYRQVVNMDSCGLVVDSTDPRAVSDAIQWLLDHPVEARKMGERGRKAVCERYTWEKEAGKLLLFYDRLTDAKRISTNKTGRE